MKELTEEEKRRKIADAQQRLRQHPNIYAYYYTPYYFQKYTKKEAYPEGYSSIQIQKFIQQERYFMEYFLKGVM